MKKGKPSRQIAVLRGRDWVVEGGTVKERRGKRQRHRAWDAAVGEILHEGARSLPALRSRSACMYSPTYCILLCYCPRLLGDGSFHFGVFVLCMRLPRTIFRGKVWLPQLSAAPPPPPPPPPSPG